MAIGMKDKDIMKALRKTSASKQKFGIYTTTASGHDELRRFSQLWI